MDLDFFFPDRLTVEHSGTEVRAQVNGSTELLLHGVAIPIKAGDVLIRELTNGLVERYVVDEATFQLGGHGLPAVTTLKVHKEGFRPQFPNASHITYSVNGENARINIHAQDHSTNVVNLTADRLFSDLREALQNAALQDDEKSRLLASVKQMELDTGNVSFASSFQTFMGLAANCVTVITPFLPALTQLISR